MPSLVAIDIETTGLDPNRSAITELAAVRFNGHRIEGEWSTLVNPGQPIPPMIVQLTGITNEMVKNAPPLNAVLAEFADFVGIDPVVGQNVVFDLSFLQKHGILQFNEIVDTYELASVLLPTASRYNLTALALQLGIPLLEDAHRALADARVTQAVFYRLYEHALQLPIEIIAELVRLSEPLEWHASWLFHQILSARTRQTVSPRSHERLNWFPPFDERLFPPLQCNDDLVPLDPDEVASILEYGGPFSQYFENYEMRSQQVEMLRQVTHALCASEHLLVEAGTGTGKSFAYLIPAALWAIQNKKRVVISTNTINLQDQLIKKDIPDLCSALQIDLRSAILKGRNNYLCPRKLNALRERGPDNADEMRVLGKLLVWLNQGGSGDRGEINLNGPAERDIWSRMSAQDDGCKAEVCVSRTGGGCPFYKARQAANAAHILVVNHALLLADVATGSRVLPEYDYLIVDEAHHLESATTNALSYRVTQGDLGRLLREMGSIKSGVLGHLLNLLSDIVRPSDMAALNQIVQRITDLSFRLDHDFKNFFTSLSDFLQDQRDGAPVGNYGHQERILSATRTIPAWGEVEMTWDTAHETQKLLINLLADVYKAIGELQGQMDDELEDLHSALGNLHRRLSEAEYNITKAVSDPDPSLIYWIEIPPNNGSLAINIAPLHVGSLMEKYLWHEKSSVILTSATLTTAGEFDYLRSRLMADEAGELALGSPFDYQSSALLYLVNDIAEPNDNYNYQRSVEQTLIRLAKATQGRMLALFTNYAQLKKTSQAISSALSEAGIVVYEQGEGSSANNLLETFKETDKAVLLGTKAFWEGVDIPGQALSILVIVKLPFDVPTDPIVAARSETFDDPFNEYNLPEAILRFRQGFGRLIRTAFDRGVVAILDKRILTKRYGPTFLQSLPECTVQRGSMQDLPARAARWLNM